jgi:hypothetical protein
MSNAEPTTIFFLAYELRPHDRADPALAEIGGAFVSAWVKAASLEQARQRAHRHLQGSGWTVLTTMKEAAVNPTGASEAMQPFFERAAAEGEVYVIDAFPAGPSDA